MPSFGYGVFSNICIGRNTTNSDFVETTYRAFFGRAADEASKQGWLDMLSGGQIRESVLAGFIGSAEFAVLDILWRKRSVQKGISSFSPVGCLDFLD